MIPPVIVPVLVAVVAHTVFSPIPEVSTEAYVVTYLGLNLLYSSFLLSQPLAPQVIIKSIFTANAIFLLSSTILTAVHRLFFSPLKRFPGPTLAAVSGIWNAREAGLGRAPRTHKGLHDKFNSDVIRIGPNELSVNNVGAIDKLYGGKYIRGLLNQAFNISGGDNVATLRDHQRHGAWRRIWGRGFGRTEIAHYAEKMQGHLDKTVQILHDQAGNPIEGGELLDNLAFDAIQDLAFSYDAGLQDGHGDPFFVKGIMGFMKFIQVRKSAVAPNFGSSLLPLPPSPNIHQGKPLVHLTNRVAKVIGHLPHIQQIFRRYIPMNEEGRLWDNHGDEILHRRQNLEASPKDLFSHLELPDRQSGLIMTQKDLKQHILLTLTVGAHSITTTSTRILAVLASRPDVQDHILQELNDAFEGDGTPPFNIVRNLKYLDGVVKEGLRMFGPLVGGTPAIAPKGGVMLDTGDFIPENTQVYIGQYVMMYDERYFPRPTEYLPERWVNQDLDKESSGDELIKDRRAWIPFGYGTHACGGRALAMEELKLIVARIVKEFEISFSDDGGQPFNYDKWADGWKDHFLTDVEEIDLKFIPRNVSK